MSVTKSASEIEATLAGFMGTERYHRYLNLVLTDGVHYLANAAGCYWLLDVIVSHQKRCRRDEACRDMQFWTIRRDADGGAVVICERDEGDELLRQEIPITDFPLESARIWVERGSVDGVNACYVAMLPGER